MVPSTDLPFAPLHTMGWWRAGRRLPIRCIWRPPNSCSPRSSFRGACGNPEPGRLSVSNRRAPRRMRQGGRSRYVSSWDSPVRSVFGGGELVAVLGFLLLLDAAVVVDEGIHRLQFDQL